MVFWQPQTFGVPLPPQVPDAQLPQFSVSPQLSEIVPQFLPSWAHVVGMHGALPH